ncbi:MAG: sugar ABC transporter ATP-binding protein [Planctomycetota bacterium]
MTHPTVLQTTGLTKRYGRITVLDDVSFAVHTGEIHALMGANGAGKSTLCKIISGLTTASKGAMHLNGRNYRPENKRQAEGWGVHIVQQEISLIPTLSVAENMFLTRLPQKFAMVDWAKLHLRARQALDDVGLHDIPPQTLVRDLGVGQQQMVEIATALTRDCRLLILDEPTAALSSGDSENLFQHLRWLRDEGVAIIYISHRLDEVFELCDRITVLRDGECVGSETSDSISRSTLISMMSGKGSEARHHTFRSAVGDGIALRVKRLQTDVLQNVTFEVRDGERFGITGLVGSGRTELLRALFGADPVDSGEIQLGDGRPRQPWRHPSEAVKAGLAMITEDRKQNGLLLTQSIRLNTTLATLRQRYSRWGTLKQADATNAATTTCDRLEVRRSSIEQLVATLSGGNQQKIVVGKWLLGDFDIFLFDEPTRGIDVAARDQIYQTLNDLAHQGVTSLIVSSDLDELMLICDRIAIMNQGKLVSTFRRDEWSREAMVAASFAEVRA